MIKIAILDVKKAFSEQLKILNPLVVINTCVPFQTSDYFIAKICITHCVHYIDLADGCGFITGIPDLDLLPAKYGIKKILFSAGMENLFIHLGIWVFSWLVRLGLPINLSKYSALLLKVCKWFNFLGSADGGMHIILKGKDTAQLGKVLTVLHTLGVQIHFTIPTLRED